MLVCCDAQDTVETLAAAVRLDPSKNEYEQWLREADGSSDNLPINSKAPFADHGKVTWSVPNEIVISRGWSKDVQNVLLLRITEAKDEYSDQGYKVTDETGDPAFGTFKSAVDSALDSPDIAGWLHVGHGTVPPSPTLGLLVFRESNPMELGGVPASQSDEVRENYGSDAFAPHHRLELIKLFSCFSTEDAVGWKAHVAPGGKFYGADKKVSGLTEGWSSLRVR